MLAHLKMDNNVLQTWRGQFFQRLRPVCSSATLLSKDVKPESGLLNVLEHGGHGAHHLRPAGPALPPPHPLHPPCCWSLQWGSSSPGVEFSSRMSSQTNSHQTASASGPFHSAGDPPPIRNSHPRLSQSHSNSPSHPRWSPAKSRWSNARAPATCQERPSTSAVLQATPKI